MAFQLHAAYQGVQQCYSSPVQGWLENHTCKHLFNNNILWPMYHSHSIHLAWLPESKLVSPYVSSLYSLDIPFYWNLFSSDSLAISQFGFCFSLGGSVWRIFLGGNFPQRFLTAGQRHNDLTPKWENLKTGVL
jgi:hypothetical protein